MLSVKNRFFLSDLKYAGVPQLHMKHKSTTSQKEGKGREGGRGEDGEAGQLYVVVRATKKSSFHFH